MQQFTVPQFIDSEDKIFGPITTRQFLIMMGSVLVGAIFYKIFYFTTFLLVTLVEFLISSIFAFVKINGMPFHYILLNFLQTSKNPSRRVWNNSFGKDVLTNFDFGEMKKQGQVVVDNRLHTSSRLGELSLIVDTQGVYHGEKDDEMDIHIESDGVNNNLKNKPKIKNEQF